MHKLRVLARVAICVAIQVVLARFLSVQTAMLRISFEFIPAALVALLYGPWWAMGGSICADLLGALLFPTGPYFPGFTLSAALTGLTFGSFLYPCRKEWRRILPAVLIVTLLINICLNTYWLTMILGKGFLVMLPGRLIKNAIMIPIEAFAIRLLAKWAPRLDNQA
ncbi:MAG: folate family ECF transporter S component [Clostridiaceae bacterium]|nr:folate family ECF transporter S component [Clostridiaceae bacterium]